MLKHSLKRFSNKIQQKDTIPNYDLVKKLGTDYFSITYNKNIRHTILKEVEEEDHSFSYVRKSAFDYLNDFVNIVMPKVENFVEERLLEKFKENLEPIERQLVNDAYMIRKYKANLKRNIEESEPVEKKEAENLIDLSIYLDNIMSHEGEGFANHDYSSIGKYTVFPEDKRNEYFPFGFYGNYEKNEFEKSQQLGIMCREYGLKLANSFSYVRTQDERNEFFDLEKIYKGEFDFKNMVNKFEVFTVFYQEFSNTFLKLVTERNDAEYNYMIQNPEIFDALVTVFVKTLRKNHINLFLVTPTTREEIFKQVLSMIHERLANKFKFSSKDNTGKDLRISEKDYYPISYFEEIINEFKVFKFTLKYEDIEAYCKENNYELILANNIDPKRAINFHLHLTSFYENCKMLWRPKDHREILERFKGFNTGGLLYGEGGSGKSMTLAYLHAWAKENNWVVFAVNDARRFTHGGYDVESHPTGLYIQPDLAKEFLIEFKIMNYEILKNAVIDYHENSSSDINNNGNYVYGNIDFAGCDINDREPNPILWDERHQVYTDSWKIHNMIPEEQINLKDHPDHKKKLSEFLKEPKTVLDIVNYGIEDDRMATNALGEVISYFKNSDNHKSIFLIDGYNEWFKPSMYDTYKYSNNKDYEYKIPPHDIAMCRMFMCFNGHMIRNGVKVVASTCHRFGNHEFTPEKINYPKNYSIKVDNLKLDDMRNAMGYLMTSGVAQEIYSEQEIQNLYSFTQGNWKQIHLDMRNKIRLLPNYTHFLYRKIRDKEIKRAKNI